MKKNGEVQKELYEFFCKLKNKSVYKNLRKLIKEDYEVDDFSLAKALSSLITHSIIELEDSVKGKEDRGQDLFLGLSLVGQVELLNRFVRGDVDGSFVREVVAEEFGKYI